MAAAKVPVQKAFKIRKSSPEFKKLDRCEKLILSTLEEESKLWFKVFDAMNTVQQEKLYTARGFSSFTQWVKYFARTELEVQESLLWKRLKAGKLLLEYVERKAAKDGEDHEERDIVLDAAKYAISPNCLDLAAKISEGDTAKFDHLVDGVESGTLKNKDLESAWKTKKQEAKKSADAEQKADTDPSLPLFNENEIPVVPVIAADIVAALSSTAWLSDFAGRTEDYRTKMDVRAEFPVYPAGMGEAKKARMMDALVMETFTLDDVLRNQLGLHGVEIKIAKSDIEHDHKWSEYEPFCDFMWLAVTPDLVEDAEKLTTPEWGILVYDKEVKGLKIHRPAKKLKAELREFTLATWIRRELGWTK